MSSSFLGNRAVAPILIGGAIAGTFDISYACIYSYLMRGTSPVLRVVQRRPCSAWPSTFLLPQWLRLSTILQVDPSPLS